MGLNRGRPLLATVEGLFATLFGDHVAPRGTDKEVFWLKTIGVVRRVVPQAIQHRQ